MRQTNHLSHRQRQASKTLMRKSVVKPELRLQPNLRVNYALDHSQLHYQLQASGLSQPHQRLNRAKTTSKSPYINHFSQPLGTSFIPNLQPIKSIVNKPLIDSSLSIDHRLQQAISRAEDQLVNFEQQPIKRFNRFTKAFMSNRSNIPSLN